MAKENNRIKSELKAIAVLLTCYNRKEKTKRCLQSLANTFNNAGKEYVVEVYLTDDGCTDGTADAVRELPLPFPVHILKGDGTLYWNGGMINSWSAAVNDGSYDGYLWLNDDTIVLPEFWNDLLLADAFSREKYGKGGIYVGSTKDANTGVFTYGGFDFVSKWTLKDKFVVPDGFSCQECQCAHGNITFVSQDVVDKMGIFYDGYQHGGGDHDYSYRAYKAGFPVLVMPHYCGECENDHADRKTQQLEKMNLRERLAYMKSPFGFNLHNSLLFQKRCFPHRYLFTLLGGYSRALFPNLYSSFRRSLRR